MFDRAAHKALTSVVRDVVLDSQATRTAAGVAGGCGSEREDIVVAPLRPLVRMRPVERRLARSCEASVAEEATDKSPAARVDRVLGLVESPKVSRQSLAVVVHDFVAHLLREIRALRIDYPRSDSPERRRGRIRHCLPLRTGELGRFKRNDSYTAR